MTVYNRGAITPYASAGVSSATIIFHIWNGWIPSIQNQGDEAQRLGQRGSIAQITGQRGRKKTVSGCICFSDKASQLAFVSTWESLEEITVKVVDGYDRTMPRVRLSNCIAEPKTGFGPPISGTAPTLYRVECTADAERLPDS